MTNSTGHENFSNFTNMPSQAGTTWQTLAAFLSALNILLSITASLGNALILVALHKVSSIHPPTKLLFRCLAATDLCIGLVVQPLMSVIIVLNVNVARTPINLFILYYVEMIINATSFILCGVSIFTSTAISVDRLLALKLGLRHRHVVTLRRVRAGVYCSWLIAISFGFAQFFWSDRIRYMAAIAFSLFCVFTSAFSYAKIFLKLRNHQTHAQEHLHKGQPDGGGIPFNIAQYKKTVSSIAWVQLAMVACYVPFIISAVVIQINGWSGMTGFTVWNFVSTLVFFNSSLNPILYCWKIRDVRQALKDTIKELCRSSS